MGRTLQLIAASGLAREVAASVVDQVRIVAVVDDEPSRRGLPVAGVPVTGPIRADVVTGHDAPMLLCAGRGTARRALAGRLAQEARSSAATLPPYAVVVDETVRVPAGSTIGAGTVLLAQVVLTADVVLGEHVVVMPAVVLTHDDVLGDFVTVCAGVRLGGGVLVGEAAYLGTGCVVRENVTIGAGATVGMGAVVLKDVPPGEVWVGNPARPMRARVLT